jgi:DNA-directed RNA polymerase specialized sigma subunit
MDQLNLSDDQRRVYEALSAVETRRGDAARDDEIATEAAMDLEAARAALAVLVSEDVDLVRQIAPAQDDLGARYRVKDNASPERP